MYRDYAIMQEAGPRARRDFLGYARPRRVGTATASCELEALGEFEHYRYIASWNQQWAGSRREWRSARSKNGAWRVWNGTDDPGTRGREWRLVVTLRNGERNVHEIVLYAWKDVS